VYSNKTQSTASCAPARGRRPAPAQDRRAAPHGRRRAAPGPRPRRRPPRRRSPTRHDTTPANRTEERRMSCHQQPAPPPRDAAKMSPRISIGPEPVLAAHAPPPPAAVSHCPAREGSAPHCGTEFFSNFQIWDSVSSNSIPRYLRTTAPTSSRQPTVPDTTANSAGAPPRFPAPVSTEGRSGVGVSSDSQDEQRQIILPQETGEQPSLSSGWSDAPWLNRRLPGVCVYYCIT
jgi:hypothetical protein